MRTAQRRAKMARYRMKFSARVRREREQKARSEEE